MKILLVDDRPENLLVLENVLAPLGHDLVRARSGTDALKHLLQEDFAVILLDVQMPGMDGFETARLIRERQRSRATPIIFLTAFSKDDEHVAVGYELGAVDYVTKPFRPEILRSKVSVFADLAVQSELARKQATLLEQRSRELERANAELRKEIDERMKAEAALAGYAEKLAFSNSELQLLARKQEDANRELQRIYQRARQLDVQRTRFFANMSHELRTPLSLILGPVSELLRESQGAGANAIVPQLEQTGLLESVEHNARLLLKHVNDLLEVARLEAGKMEVRYTAFDFAELMRRTAANFEGLAQQRGMNLLIDVPPSLPVEGDPEKLQRVLLNLMSNAFKFTPVGGTVHCAARAAGDKLVFSVADSGPGVPAAARETVFERFRQLDSSDERQFGGTGLGLSITRELLELHHGTARIEDAPEGGAKLVCELPLKAPDGTRMEASAAPAVTASEATRLAMEEFRTEPLAAVAGSGEALVLVVEDNPRMSHFIANAMAGEYRVATAADGREGLEKAMELRPDLILTDIMMPAAGGEEFIRQVRECRELEGVPIIAVTARADDELRVQLLRRGVQDYLLKPFSVEELRARAGNLITMKRIRDVLHREVINHEKDVVAVVKDLLATRAELQKAVEALERKSA